MENHSAVKKNEIMPLKAMDGSRNYYAKWSNSDREMQISYNLGVESETMKQRNLCTSQKWIHRHRKPTSGYQRGNQWERKLRNLELIDIHY